MVKKAVSKIFGREVVDEAQAASPKAAKKVSPSPKVRTSSQPKSFIEEKRLAMKYAAIEDVEERAFQILVDLGMVAATP